MNPLSLALLGTPQVRYQGRAVTFATRKVLALLTYLAVEGGAPSREQLTALLWPESSSELGRASLRKALAYLRQVLGADQTCLIVEHDTLRLEPAVGVTVDVWALQAAAQALRQPPLASPGTLASLPSAHLRQLLEPLQQAVNLYRGDFLSGFSLSDAPEFDDWASLQREVWHRQATLIFDRLSQLQFESGELAPAVETASRWTAHDPLDEAAYRRLMQLHFANGDRAAALQVYMACRAMLAREFAVEPSPELEALARRLRVAELRSAAAGPHLKAGPPSPPADLSPLVGRAFEHVQLVNAFRASQQEGPQVITLEGEPGIGKTRLANDFLAWATTQGAEVWSGRAFEAGGRLPYQPLVEALRSFHDQQPQVFTTFPPVWRGELSRLLPELADSRLNPSVPASTNEAEVRLRLFEAIAHLGQAVTDAAALLLFIDDLQWADAATLEVLPYLLRRWLNARRPVLLLFTVRTEALLANPTLSSWLNGLRRDAPLTRLTLNPLTLDDTRQLVRAISQGLPASVEPLPPALDRFSQELFAETSGQPFFMVQTLRSLAERGLWQRDEDGTWQAHMDREMPNSVRDLIQSRLVNLSPAAQACCAAGAVLGDGFEFEPLTRVADLTEKEALVGLEELLARGIWREAGAELPVLPRYFFSHDRIREVSYAQLSETRRRLLHREALKSLSAGLRADQASAPLAQLAYHALRAGLPAQAFYYSVQAGEAAQALYALSDAIVHLEQARHLLEQGDLRLEGDVPAQDETLIFNLYIYLGRAYELSGQLELAIELYESLLGRIRGRGDRVRECLALNRLATVQLQAQGNQATAQSLLQAALAVAEASGNMASLAETEWNLAQLNHYWARPNLALAHAERALALARQINQTELVARSLNNLAYSQSDLQRWPESAASADEAQALYAALGDRAMLVDSLLLVVQAKLALGEPAAAINLTRQALTIAEEIENPWGQVNGKIQLALGLLESGYYEPALALAQQASALAQAHHLDITFCIAPLVLGRAYGALGQLELARQTHLEAEQFNAQIASAPFRAPIAAALCADCARLGAWEEAYAWARKALETRPVSLGFHAGLTFWYEVEALLRAGEVVQAVEEVQRFGERIGANPRYRIPYLRSLAVLSLIPAPEAERFAASLVQFSGQAAGAQAALAHLEEANRLAEEIGLPGEQQSILVALAELYRASGQEAKVREAMIRGAEIEQALAVRIEDNALRTRFMKNA